MMSEKKTLLIIAHVPSENTQKMLSALIKGISDNRVENVEARCLAPLDTQPSEINSADAIIIGTTENLGYMAGLIKDVFDRCFYECIENTEGLPFTFYVRAGHDGTGTKRAIESISDNLHLPFQNANITRLDVAQNLLMKHPEDLYFKYLGQSQFYKRLEQPDGLYFNNSKRQ